MLPGQNTAQDRSNLSSSEQLRPLIKNGAIAPGHYVISGPRGLPAHFLTGLCPLLASGMNVLWLDAGNSFNAYGAGYATRSIGAPSQAALARIDLARPFNLYQLETMVRVKVPKRWRGEPIVISDPMPLFYDEDVPVATARRVFQHVLEGMMSLSAVWLTLAIEREAPPERKSWEGDLIRNARGAMRLYGTNTSDDRDDAPGRRGRLETF